MILKTITVLLAERRLEKALKVGEKIARTAVNLTKKIFIKK